MRSVLLVAAVVVGACAEDAAQSTKYLQTWTRAYGETTCADWHQSMSERERFVMASDVLFTLHKRTKPSASRPSDRVAGRFQTGINETCPRAGEELKRKVVEVATPLYESSSSLGPE